MIVANPIHSMGMTCQGIDHRIGYTQTPCATPMRPPPFDAHPA